MLQARTRLHPLSSFQVPAHLESVAYTGIDLIQQAHMYPDSLPPEGVRILNDYDAHRLYVEKRGQQAYRNYELLAVHLGATSLSICLDHHHDNQPVPHRTSLVLEGARASLHYTHQSGVGSIENIRDNEKAAGDFADHFYHALGELGVETSTYAHLRAS